ncbi:hypothetical protein BLA29_013775 [Euroglyphus maynei]|uniref:Uncharacterized protein n=1 Tax=Euroglyphus maynei TaxID=6958 RepID=A0A1Y3B2J1_EURMA|nr:hypothetical protein BLA29_013775 [Euroglyphus maynei]
MATIFNNNYNVPSTSLTIIIWLIRNLYLWWWWCLPSLWNNDDKSIVKLNSTLTITTRINFIQLKRRRRRQKLPSYNNNNVPKNFNLVIILGKIYFFHFLFHTNSIV